MVTGPLILSSEIFGTVKFYPDLVVESSKHPYPFLTLVIRPRPTGTKLIPNQSLPNQKLF